MKKIFLAAAMAIALHPAQAADTLKVSSFRYAGPFAVQAPYIIDSTNVNKKAFELKGLLERPLQTDALKTGMTVSEAPACDDDALHMLGFSIDTRRFAKASLKVNGIKDHVIYVDGSKVDGSALKLEPATHDVVIKYLTLKDAKADSARFDVSLIVEKGGPVTCREDGKKLFSLDLNTQGESCGGVTVSPEGRYVVIGHRMTDAAGKSSSFYELRDLSDGRTLMRTREPISWMPCRDAYYYTRNTVSGRSLIVADPATGAEEVLAVNLPEGQFRIAPTEDYLIYSLEDKGPKEGDVHQILAPDDRQPGWRDRGYLARYDLATGFLQPLTYGYHNVWLNDISDDGAYILFTTSRERLTKRPTTLYSLYRMDVRSLTAECLIEDDGYINGGSFSPDGTKVLVTCSPEAFGGACTSKDLKPGQIPNSFDVQLAVLDIASRKMDPVTLKFAPSVLNASWSRFDGKIYLMAEDKDCRNLYRIDPHNSKAERLPNKEEYMTRFSLSRTTPDLVYCGQSLCNGERAYRMDVKAPKHDQVLLHDWSASRLGDVTLGEGGAYEFKSSRGDVINGFYVLPPDFDPSRKYPMLVHYYGGCSPSARYCIGSYSPQYYAAQGYVFYVINPSGAAGFGQDFAARHVNTAGDVVADDIIEATERFCADHPFVDKEHVGCFSASYGGFMTQLLLTKTDIYATGISHAGISSHTSYWGEGYWGYSYSETSMADSYPWTRKDLYVDRSPLYNADKIHTPLLFLHGSADTNVPVGESIQMFTALKLLGAETAFVMVDGENHGIAEYSKRRQWLRTISAWFAKYLQEDSTWWDELYPEKNL